MTKCSKCKKYLVALEGHECVPPGCKQHTDVSLGRREAWGENLLGKSVFALVEDRKCTTCGEEYVVFHQ